MKGRGGLMIKFKRFMTTFLSFAMVFQAVMPEMPQTVVKAAEIQEDKDSQIVFTDFEKQEGLVIGGGSNNVLTTEKKHGGEYSLKYVAGGTPGSASSNNAEVTTSAAIDISGYDNMTFWIFDEGENNLEIKLTDENGNEDKKWSPDDNKSVSGQWTQITVPLDGFNKIDKTKVKKVSFWEWNPGTYYIDDICFEKKAEEIPDTRPSGSRGWFQQFETGDAESMFELPETGTEALISEEGGYNGTGKGLVYIKTGSGDPVKKNGSILIKGKEAFNCKGLRYLVFYIKDMQGSNTLKVSLLDEDGKESSFSWLGVKTAKEKWKQYYMELDKVSGVDLTKITGVRIGEWNSGTYYIDNVYFDNYLTPGSPDVEIPEVNPGEIKASKEAGDYTEVQNIEFFAESGAEIYYTTDGTEPDADSGKKYSGIINIPGNMVIKAVSIKDGVAGNVYTFEYNIVPYPVTASHEAGTYTDSVIVEFRTKNDKDLIYYTTDGSEPDRDNNDKTIQFIKPMLVTESTTFKAVAYKKAEGKGNQPVEIKYIINKSGKTAAPVFSRPEGTYGGPVSIELKADGDIYYTTDGSVPGTSSVKYENAIQVSQDMQIRAIAVKDGKESGEVKASYVINTEKTPFLKADGKVLKDNFGTGDTVALRGTNAGGWLVTENWQCPVNAKDQLTTLKVFTERFGADKAQELIDYYQDNWWTEEDFDLVKAEGMNVLRLPITYFEMQNSDGTLKETAFKRLDWFVQNCAKRGIYILIDMHGAMGSQNGKDHSGDTSIADKGNFYDNEENIKKTIYLWEEIARKYKDNPWVCGYDLLNEPSATGTIQFDVYDRLYKAIRAIDKDHALFIQSIWEPYHLPDPSFYGWQNVVYEYHFYGWDVEKDAEGQMAFIQSKVKMANEDTNYDVPLLVGEFTFFSNENSWNAMDIFEEQGWSYTSWTFKVTGKNSSWGMFTSDDKRKVDIYKDSYETIKEKWSKEEISTTSEAFTRNVKYADILKKYFANNAKNKPGTADATGISIKNAVTIEPGKTVNLDAKNIPDNTAYQSLYYTSSNEDIAVADASGTVTAKAEGKAVITVTNMYGMSAECVVTVSKTGESVPTTSPGKPPVTNPGYVTQYPSGTPEPENTPVPGTTAPPESTKEPESTTVPGTTAVPEGTTAPENTAAPEGTNTPEPEISIDEETGAVTETTKVTDNNTNSVLVKSVTSDAEGNITGTNAAIHTGLSDTGSQNSVKVIIPQSFLNNIKDAGMDKADIYIEKITVDAVKNNLASKMVIKIEVPETSGVAIGKVILGKESIESAKESNKKLVVKIQGKNTSGKYTVTIPQSQLKKMDSSTDISVKTGKVSGMESGSKKVNTILAANKLGGDNSYTVTIAPDTNKGGIKVTTPVLLTGVKAGDSVYVYRYNKNTGKLEEIPNNKRPVIKDGEAAIEGFSGNTYVITDKELSGKNVVTLLGKIKVLAGKTSIKPGAKTKIKVNLGNGLVSRPSVNSKTPYAKQAAVVTYKASNKKIKVSQNGTVTAKRSGKAKVIIKIKLAGGKVKVFKKHINIK